MGSFQQKKSLINKGSSNAFRKNKIGNPDQAGYRRPYEIDRCIHVDRTGADDDESRGQIIKTYKD
jgi:hypothetical protein